MFDKRFEVFIVVDFGNLKLINFSPFLNSSHPKVLLKSKLILCHGSELRQNQEIKLKEKIAELESQLTGDMFKDMPSRMKFIGLSWRK